MVAVVRLSVVVGLGRERAHPIDVFGIFRGEYLFFGCGYCLDLYGRLFDHIPLFRKCCDQYGGDGFPIDDLDGECNSFGFALEKKM